MKFEIFTEMKEQLLNSKELLKDQKQYIINLALNFEAGYDPLTVIHHTKLIPTAKGKLSTGYRKAKALQDSELKKAVSLLDGSDYNRCQKLEASIKNVKLQFKLGDFRPSNDIEHIIFKLLKNGLKPPDTARHLYELLY